MTINLFLYFFGLSVDYKNTYIQYSLADDFQLYYIVVKFKITVDTLD